MSVPTGMLATVEEAVLTFTEVPVPDGIAQRLAASPPTGDKEVVILPTNARSGEYYYDLDDVMLNKVAVAEGLDAHLLDEDPRVLHEFSAGWVADIWIGVSSGLVTNALTYLGIVLRRRAQDAVARGVHSGPADAMPLKLGLTRVDTTTEVASETGAVTRTVRAETTIRVEGATGQVVEQLADIMRSAGVIDTPPDPDAVTAPVNPSLGPASDRLQGLSTTPEPDPSSNA